MTVITRFAPSPTGFLHIGGARTALFNWLFARHHGGKFMLRIEDTDRARSTDAAIDAILDGMHWLGLEWDDEVVYQFSRTQRHAEVVDELLKNGNAYYCYTSAEELASLREEAKASGKQFRYDSKWRHCDPSEAPAGAKPSVRLRAPLDGETKVHDVVQGDVVVANNQLDDMVLLRSDGTPTYMLAVVVDDHDMGITHIIRGDDHLTNAARQTLLYKAMGWNVPVFAHIPLIHGADGAKLSKRHGALGVDAYRDMGYLPEALRNYLLRLGWSHGNDEIISTKQAIEWFNLESIGKSAARFDFAKLENLNGIYIREADDLMLVELVCEHLRLRHIEVTALGLERLTRGMSGLKQRAKTIVELTDNAIFYVVSSLLTYTEAAGKILEEGGKSLLQEITPLLADVSDWSASPLELLVKAFAEEKDIKLGKIAQALRSALTGSTVSPGMFEVMEVLGKDEVLERLRQI
jgi:glutamyl-tRNA synthetase